MRQAVVFLARGIGCGLSASRAFFESYRAYAAGRDHDLIVLLKGWEGVSGQDEVREMARNAAASVIELPDDGYDWGAYMRAAEMLPHEWVCFLNTYSRILAPGWLAKLSRAAAAPGVAAAGASGSFGTALPNLGLLPARFQDVRQRRGVALAAAAALQCVAGYPNGMAQLRPHFSEMPNPHLRSNAFLLRREDFLAFVAVTRIPATKTEALMLENGRDSLTGFLRKNGRETVVAGADGKFYRPEAWPQSGTFWVPGQPNLLIADNQTQAYADAAAYRRRFLEQAAWGRAVTPAAVKRLTVPVDHKQGC
jgi:hypothetical protein